MADQRRHRVLDRPPLRQHAERLGLERQHLAVAAHPVVGVPLVAAVGGVHGRRAMSARRPSPRTGRTRAGRTSAGPGSPGTGAGRIRTARAPRSTHPLELLDGLLDDGQGDDRRGEDAVLVVERPGLVHPLVEGVDDGVDQLGVVAHALLDQAGERREHEGAVEALLVHQLDPGLGLPERRDRAHRLAEDLAPALALGVAVPEVVLLGAGAGHDVEGGVGDVVADLAPDDDLRAALDLDVVDGALVAVGQVLGERLLGLVEVVVGVEHRDVELDRRHRRTLRGAEMALLLDESIVSGSGSPTSTPATAAYRDEARSPGRSRVRCAARRAARRGSSPIGTTRNDRSVTPASAKDRSRFSIGGLAPGGEEVADVPWRRPGRGGAGSSGDTSASARMRFVRADGRVDLVVAAQADRDAGHDRGAPAGRPSSAARVRRGRDVRRRWPARRPSRGSCRRCARPRARSIFGPSAASSTGVGATSVIVERVVDPEQLVVDVDGAGPGEGLVEHVEVGAHGRRGAARRGGRASRR